MRIVDCVQGTPAWWEARMGYPTASAFDQIMTPKKRTASASQPKYIAQLIGDITNPSPNYFTGQGGPVNRATEYGRQTEDEARRFYEMRVGVSVQQVGFCIDDTGRIGCSPDGLVGEEGGLELKCPERHTHMLYLMQNRLPLEYWCQCHGFLIVTGRKWIDFMSYCTNVEPLIIRVVPDDFTRALRVQLELFLVRFAEAKKRFNVNQQDEPLTDLTRQAAEEHASQLIRLEDEMKEKGDDGPQHGIDTINGWIKDMQDRPGVAPVPLQTKREVWRVLWAFAERQGWHYDTVNKRLMKDKEEAF